MIIYEDLIESLDGTDRDELRIDALRPDPKYIEVDLSEYAEMCGEKFFEVVEDYLVSEEIKMGWEAGTYYREEYEEVYPDLSREDILLKVFEDNTEDIFELLGEVGSLEDNKDKRFNPDDYIVVMTEDEYDYLS